MDLQSRIRALISRASRTSFRKCAYSLTPGTLKAVVMASHAHAHNLNTDHSLWEYAPTAMISLSYRTVKGIVPRASELEPNDAVFSDGKGGVAGI